jgi:hypothetical protein
MEIGTCANCSYWGKPDYASRPNIFETKQCQKPLLLWNAGAWDEAGNFSLQPEYAETKVFVQDASDYYAALYTKADFFCAHWQLASA